jgi:hypothetical protein
MAAVWIKAGIKPVVMNHMASPLSIFSGNRLKVQSRTVKFTAQEIKKDLTPLGACPGCDSILRANRSAIASFQNTKLHCMVCGTYLSDKDLVKVKADDDANVPDDDEDDDTVSADADDDGDGDGDGDVTVASLTISPVKASSGSLRSLT